MQSIEASSKGFHIGATRPRPEGRQDGGHHGAQDGVITRAFCRRRPPFVTIACTSCPLSNCRCWLPSRSIFGERTRASINRTSHHRGTIKLSLNDTSSPSTRTPRLRRLFFPLYCSSSAQEAIHHHHTRVGYYTTNGGPNQYKSRVSLCCEFVEFVREILAS